MKKMIAVLVAGLFASAAFAASPVSAAAEKAPVASAGEEKASSAKDEGKADCASGAKAASTKDVAGK